MKAILYLFLLIPVILFQSFIISDIIQTFYKTIKRSRRTSDEVHYNEKRRASRRPHVTAIK